LQTCLGLLQPDHERSQADRTVVAREAAFLRVEPEAVVCDPVRDSLEPRSTGRRAPVTPFGAQDGEDWPPVDSLRLRRRAEESRKPRAQAPGGRSGVRKSAMQPDRRRATLLRLRRAGWVLAVRDNWGGTAGEML